jgi:hypothetical protein
MRFAPQPWARSARICWTTSGSTMASSAMGSAVSVIGILLASAPIGGGQFAVARGVTITVALPRGRFDSGSPNNTVAYGDCHGKPRRQDSDPPACAGGMICQPWYTFDGEGQWCSPSCDATGNGSDCPAAPGVASAFPACREVDPGWSLCVLTCRGDPTCPTGMQCMDGACVWKR